jgi:hypothetical protein
VQEKPDARGAACGRCVQEKPDARGAACGRCVQKKTRKKVIATFFRSRLT